MHSCCSVPLPTAAARGLPPATGPRQVLALHLDLPSSRCTCRNQHLRFRVQIQHHLFQAGFPLPNWQAGSPSPPPHGPWSASTGSHPNCPFSHLPAPLTGPKSNSPERLRGSCQERFLAWRVQHSPPRGIRASKSNVQGGSALPPTHKIQIQAKLG